MDDRRNAATSRQLTAVDLFAGCGGLTVGLKRAGFRVLAAVELDCGAARTYRLNHPDVENLFVADIRGVSGNDLIAPTGLKVGDLDLLAGCPPCQGFSRMTTLNGTRAEDDPRNDLVLDYLRLVDELKPRALLLENVPALRQDRRYTALRARLIQLGYKINDDVHDAADFGVPQRRHRLILLAARSARPTMPGKLPTEWRTTVRRAITTLGKVGASGDEAHDVTESRMPHVQRLISQVPRDGGSRKDLDDSLQLDCHKRCSGFSDVYGRMRWDDVAPTITSGFVNPSKGRFLHPSADRTITPREAALLQTFPPDYRFPMSLGKYAIARMIGNALPPRLAALHAAALAETLRAERADRSHRRRTRRSASS